MKAFAKLTVNEIKKLLSQTAIKVIAIIWAVLTVLTPVFVAAESSLLGFLEATPYYDESSYYEDAVEAAYFGTTYKVYTALKENGFERGWVNDTYFDYLDGLETGLAFYSLVLEEGYSFEKVNETFYYYDTYSEEAPTEEEMKSDYMLLKEEHAAFLEILETGNVELLVNNRIEQIKNEIAFEKEFSSMNQLTTEYDSAVSAFVIDVLERSCKAYEKIVADGNTDKNWMLNTAEYVYNMQYDSYSVVPQSEQDYSDYSSLPYEEYLIEAERSRKVFDVKMSVLEYSLEHNMPLSSVTYETYTKDIWQTGIGLGTTMAAFTMLIAAAGSLASEYSTGTIRMLLIRPRKRSKILLSKYAAILTVGLGMILASYIIQLPISMLLGGLDGLTADIFVTSTGHVYHLNVFVSSLLSALSAYVSSAFVASVAFYFSTVVGKTALAMLFAYLTTMLSGIVSSSIGTLTYFGVPHKVVDVINAVMSFTFIPYANFNSYYAGANQMLSINIFSMTGGAGLPENRIITTVVILVWTALVVWLASVGFKKKDIKS